MIVPFDGARNQHLSFALARLGLVANVAFAIDKIQVLLVVSFQVQLLYLFGHTSWTVEAHSRMPADFPLESRYFFRALVAVLREPFLLRDFDLGSWPGG